MRYGAGVGLTAGAAAYLFAPWTLVAALGALLYVAGAAALPRLALQLVVVSTPFYLLDKQAGSLPFSPTEFLWRQYFVNAPLDSFNTLEGIGLGLDYWVFVTGDAQTQYHLTPP